MATTTVQTSSNTSTATQPDDCHQDVDSTGSDDRNSIITDTELSECDREQLHLIGHIQGNSGHVLYMTYPDMSVIGYDSDILQIPWISPQSLLLGKSLSTVIPSELQTNITSSINGMIQSKSLRSFLFYTYEGKAFALSMFSAEHTNSDRHPTTTENHYNHDHNNKIHIDNVVDMKDNSNGGNDKFNIFGMEIEIIDERESADTFFNTVTNLGRVMDLYNQDFIVKTACETVFNLVQCYDRGMVYKFNDDLSGEVIYEIKAPSITTSYIGMRYECFVVGILYFLNAILYMISY